LSNSTIPELSRIVKAKGLPAEPVVIDADPAERTALAKRFGLPGVDVLHAEIALEQRAKSIRAGRAFPRTSKSSSTCVLSKRPLQIPSNTLTTNLKSSSTRRIATRSNIPATPSIWARQSPRL